MCPPITILFLLKLLSVNSCSFVFTGKNKGETQLFGQHSKILGTSGKYFSNNSSLSFGK